MKYYTVKFTSSSGISTTGFYTTSKDKKSQIKLDYNRELLVSEDEIKDLMDRYDVYSVIYAGVKWEKSV